MTGYEVSWRWLGVTIAGGAAMGAGTIMAACFAVFAPVLPFTSPAGLTCLSLMGAGAAAVLTGLVMGTVQIIRLARDKS